MLNTYPYRNHNRTSKQKMSQILRSCVTLKTLPGSVKPLQHKLSQVNNSFLPANDPKHFSLSGSFHVQIFLNQPPIPQYPVEPVLYIYMPPWLWSAPVQSYHPRLYLVPKDDTRHGKVMNVPVPAHGHFLKSHEHIQVDIEILNHMPHGSNLNSIYPSYGYVI